MSFGRINPCPSEPGYTLPLQSQLIWICTICHSELEFITTIQIKQYVTFVTGAPNWYWLTVGQGLLSLQQVRVEECCYFFCSFTFFHFPPSSLSLSFISSTIFSIFFLTFSGRWHKMTHKGWNVVKPQHNQSIKQSDWLKIRNGRDILI